MVYSIRGSFGGLLAPSVALCCQSKLNGLIMINPETLYDDTSLDSYAPLLTSLRHLESENKNREERYFPLVYSFLGGAALAATVLNYTQFQKIVNLIQDSPLINDESESIILSSRNVYLPWHLNITSPSSCPWEQPRSIPV